MISHDDFLRAIAAQPDDRLRQLIYADWLEEQGDGELAALLRCMGNHGKSPIQMSARGDRLLWCWFRITGRGFALVRVDGNDANGAVVSEKVYQNLAGFAWEAELDYGWFAKGYETAQAACEALHQAVP